MVEVGSTVKCITGIDGVPIVTQWDERGYMYPITIAQYGLSHFSKWVERPQGEVINNCEKAENLEWVPIRKGAYVKNVYDSERRSQVMEFSINGRYH